MSDTFDAPRADQPEEPIQPQAGAAAADALPTSDVPASLVPEPEAAPEPVEAPEAVAAVEEPETAAPEAAPAAAEPEAAEPEAVEPVAAEPAPVFRYAADDLERTDEDDEDADADDEDEDVDEFDEDVVRPDSGIGGDSPHLPGGVDEQLSAARTAPEPATSVLPAAETERLEPTQAWPEASIVPALTQVRADAPRFCPECGTELQEGARFCPECGSPILVSAQPYVPSGASLAAAPAPAAAAPQPTFPAEGQADGAAADASAAAAAAAAATAAAAAPGVVGAPGEADAQSVPPASGSWDAPHADPEQSVVETASATTDREAARSTSPVAFILAAVALALSIASAASIGSCTAAVFHEVAQEAAHSISESVHSYEVSNPHGFEELDPELQQILQQFDDGSSLSVGTTSARTGAYTTADALADQALSLLNGTTISVGASEFSGVQPAVSDFVRSVVSADQEAMDRVQRHLRSAAAATEDAVRTEELQAARTAVTEALDAAGKIAVPAAADLTESAGGTAEQIASEAQRARDGYQKRWQAFLDELDAVITPLNDFRQLYQLDLDMCYAADDQSIELSELLYMATR